MDEMGTMKGNGGGGRGWSVVVVSTEGRARISVGRPWISRALTLAPQPFSSALIGSLNSPPPCRGFYPILARLSEPARR